GYARASGSPPRTRVSFAHQVLDHRLQVVVVRVDLLDVEPAGRRQLRQPAVEGVRGVRLDHDGLVAGLHPHPLDVVPGQQVPGQLAVVFADQDDVVRVLVDQVADLPDLPLGHQPAAVEQDNVRGQRVD